MVSSDLGGQLFVHLHIQSSPVQCTCTHVFTFVTCESGGHVMWWKPLSHHICCSVDEDVWVRVLVRVIITLVGGG